MFVRKMQRLTNIEPCRGGYYPPAVYEATTAGEQSSTLQVDCEGISGINPARFYFPEVEKTALSCYNQHKSEENSEKVENFAKRVEYNDCFTA